METIYTFLFTSILLCIAPGPDNIFVLTQSALFGCKKGILVTLGLCTGLIVHTTAVAFGVAAIIKASPFAFTILKYIGAFYLLYLAWQAFSTSLKNLGDTQSNRLSDFQFYRRGIIMNITNPKITIFFLAFLPQFTNPDQGGVILQVLFLGLLFILITSVVFGAVAFMAGSLASWFNRSPIVQVYLNRIAGVVYSTLALNLLFGSSFG
ncbi:MAG: LysE family translocator [Candidatus Thiodiazotropha sp. L084R]